jgi:superfamily I DNA/RNA helicase
MARLAIDKDFLDDYSKLPKPVQNNVKTAIEKFAEHVHAGIHLEKLSHSKDDRIRTIRIDQFWRGVVLAPDSGDTYSLIRVLPHDKAIDYAASHKFTVNGALVKMIPEAQYNALFGLACGQTPEEAWAEVSQYAPTEPVDTANIVKAMERTPGRVVFIDSNKELDRILEHPFATWRIFLHPAQRKIAYAPRYAGPAQVTGGAGTGKTVTALHRAAHLARQASEELFAAEEPGSVLLTTFTRNLADALETQFDLLVDTDDVRRQVEIINVDRLAYRVAEQSRGTRPAIIDNKDLTDLWAAAAGKAGLPFASTFLIREWEQVILAQDLRAEQDYLACSRAGQGTPLGKAQRRQVWQLTQQVDSELNAMGRSTFVQLANEAARFLSASGQPPYRHVIIDEAQDLHPAQWRLLRAAVPVGLDDMFIVGDPHQRIYGNHVSLAKLGINVRGRSRRLKINYRTTQEILALAVPALGNAPVTGLDDEADSLAGYRSPLHGRRPEVHAAVSREAELAALSQRIRGWIDDGIEPHAIGVAARSGSLGKQASAALAAAGIATVSLAAKSRKDAVRVGTMHGMKGLEFQAVAVFGVEEGRVPAPAPAAVTPAGHDPVAHAQDLQRERCLLFVACTRARDHLYVSYSGTPSPFLRES